MIPNAKIILTLRNPVTRLISQYKKNLLQGKKNIIPDIDAHIERDMRGESPPSVNFVFSNKYRQHLEHVFNCYRREQIFLMIFEEWTKSPEIIIPELLKFLDVRNNIDMNPLKALNRIEKFNNKSFFKKSITDIRKYIMKGANLNAHKSTHFVIKESTKNKLVELFSEDVAMVEKVLNRKVAAWDN